MLKSDGKASTLPANTKNPLHSQLTHPDVKIVIHAVSTILYQQMIKEIENNNPIDKDSDLYFFSEEKYIQANPDKFSDERKQLLQDMPTIDNIQEFLKALFDCAQFSPECCIIGLIYINRLMAFTGLTIKPQNWRPLLVSTLLVAQKVWDDKYLSNADFAFIYPFFTFEEITKLEVKFLQLLQYKLTVKGSLYAQYYFELSQIKKDQEFPVKSLSVEEQSLLEQRSYDFQKLQQEKAERLSHTLPEKILKNEISNQ